LQINLSCHDFLEQLKSKKEFYEPFNIVIGDLLKDEIYWYSNKIDEIQKLESGRLYGVSNWFLDTPWTKVVLGKQLLEDLRKEAIESKDNEKTSTSLNECFLILQNKTECQDSELPGIIKDKNVEKKTELDIC